MPTSTSLFDFDLPESFIAQAPAEPRDSSKLFVLGRRTGEVRHKVFREILDELQAGDVMVFNRSKVFKARLVHGDTEVFVLRIRDGEIDALVRPGKKFAVGSIMPIRNFEVLSKTDDGVVTLRTGLSTAEMLEFCELHGSVPLPPYIETELDVIDRYQTVYAKETGSVAAPTAGLHFTPELIDRLRLKGVQIEEVVLHVGLGTFRPMQGETIEEHVMHEEWVSLSQDVADRILQAKNEHRRIIAVGTTTVRVLEGIVAKLGELQSYEGEINMFITPGFDFKVIDGLVTNFHLPKSTLLVLVSAFAGRENVLAAYEEAKRQDYRFFSFGDAMLIV